MLLSNSFRSFGKSKITRKVSRYISDRLIIADKYFVCIFVLLFQYQLNFKMTRNGLIIVQLTLYLFKCIISYPYSLTNKIKS